MSVDINNSMLTEKALDYAKISSLAYARWTYDESSKKWNLNVDDEKQYGTLWAEMKLKGYSVVDYCPNDPNTGYSGTIFKYTDPNTNTQKYILANRGSELGWPWETDPKDAIADKEIAESKPPIEQFNSMVNFINSSILASVQFDVTGHSLGGCLAQMAKNTYANSIGDIYTYNAPGADNFSGFSNVGERVYNISGKDGLSGTADKGTDIGREIFVNGSSHKIDKVTSSASAGVYYTDSKNPVTIIGSKGNETFKTHDSGHYTGSAQKVTFVGGYGNDIIYGGDAGDELYGDLPQAIIDSDTTLKTSGNYGGAAGKDWISGGEGNDTIFGGGNNDTIYGGVDNDVLYGGLGNDIITGGAGNDTLYGGKGFDIYFYYAGDGNDTIIDEDGDGRIAVKAKNGTWAISDVAASTFYRQGTSNIWTNATGTIKITHNSPWQIVLGDGSTIQLGDADVSAGAFGINLMPEHATPSISNVINLNTEDPSHVNHQFQAPGWGTSADDSIVGGSGHDVFGNNDAGGSDWMVGGAGNDVINSWGTGDDILEGDAGVDVLIGGVSGTGNNVIYSEFTDYDSDGVVDTMSQFIANGEIAPNLNTTGDIATGGDGDDIIYGSNAKDALLGGDGYDLLVGGGGDDIILGDATISLVDLAGIDSGTYDDPGYSEDFWNWSYSVTVTPSGNTNIYTYTFANVFVNIDDTGTIGDDDVIYSGTGNDVVDGGGGDDDIYFVDNASGNKVINFRNIIPFRQKIKHQKHQNTGRRFSQSENLRRAA